MLGILRYYLYCICSTCMFGLTVGVQYCSGIGKFLGKRVVDGFKVATTCVYVLKYAHCFCSLILNILHTLIGTAWYDGTGVGRAGGTRGLCCLTKAGQGGMRVQRCHTQVASQTVTACPPMRTRTQECIHLAIETWMHKLTLHIPHTQAVRIHA